MTDNINDKGKKQEGGAQVTPAAAPTIPPVQSNAAQKKYLDTVTELTKKAGLVGEEGMTQEKYDEEKEKEANKVKEAWKAKPVAPKPSGVAIGMKKTVDSNITPSASSSPPPPTVATPVSAPPSNPPPSASNNTTAATPVTSTSVVTSAAPPPPSDVPAPPSWEKIINDGLVALGQRDTEKAKTIKGLVEVLLTSGIPVDPKNREERDAVSKMCKALLVDRNITIMDILNELKEALFQYGGDIDKDNILKRADFMLKNLMELRLSDNFKEQVGLSYLREIVENKVTFEEIEPLKGKNIQEIFPQLTKVVSDQKNKTVKPHVVDVDKEINTILNSDDVKDINTKLGDIVRDAYDLITEDEYYKLGWEKPQQGLSPNLVNFTNLFNHMIDYMWKSVAHEGCTTSSIERKGQLLYQVLEESMKNKNYAFSYMVYMALETLETDKIYEHKDFSRKKDFFSPLSAFKNLKDKINEDPSSVTLASFATSNLTGANENPSVKDNVINIDRSLIIRKCLDVNITRQATNKDNIPSKTFNFSSAKKLISDKERISAVKNLKLELDLMKDGMSLSQISKSIQENLDKPVWRVAGKDGKKHGVTKQANYMAILKFTGENLKDENKDDAKEIAFIIRAHARENGVILNEKAQEILKSLDDIYKKGKSWTPDEISKIYKIRTHNATVAAALEKVKSTVRVDDLKLAIVDYFKAVNGGKPSLTMEALNNIDWTKNNEVTEQLKGLSDSDISNIIKKMNPPPTDAPAPPPSSVAPQPIVASAPPLPSDAVPEPTAAKIALEQLRSTALSSTASVDDLKLAIVDYFKAANGEKSSISMETLNKINWTNNNEVTKQLQGLSKSDISNIINKMNPPALTDAPAPPPSSVAPPPPADAPPLPPAVAPVVTVPTAAPPLPTPPIPEETEDTTIPSEEGKYTTNKKTNTPVPASSPTNPPPPQGPSAVASAPPSASKDVSQNDAPKDTLVLDLSYANPSEDTSDFPRPTGVVESNTGSNSEGPTTLEKASKKDRLMQKIEAVNIEEANSNVFLKEYIKNLLNEINKDVHPVTKETIGKIDWTNNDEVTKNLGGLNAEEKNKIIQKMLLVEIKNGNEVAVNVLEKKIVAFLKAVNGDKSLLTKKDLKKINWKNTEEVKEKLKGLPGKEIKIITNVMNRPRPKNTGKIIGGIIAVAAIAAAVTVSVVLSAATLGVAPAAVGAGIIGVLFAGGPIVPVIALSAAAVISTVAVAIGDRYDKVKHRAKEKAYLAEKSNVKTEQVTLEASNVQKDASKKAPAAAQVAAKKPLVTTTTPSMPRVQFAQPLPQQPATPTLATPPRQPSVLPALPITPPPTPPVQLATPVVSSPSVPPSRPQVAPSILPVVPTPVAPPGHTVLPPPPPPLISPPSQPMSFSITSPGSRPRSSSAIEVAGNSLPGIRTLEAKQELKIIENKDNKDNEKQVLFKEVDASEKAPTCVATFHPPGKDGEAGTTVYGFKPGVGLSGTPENNNPKMFLLKTAFDAHILKKSDEKMTITVLQDDPGLIRLIQEMAQNKKMQTPNKLQVIDHKGNVVNLAPATPTPNKLK